MKYFLRLPLLKMFALGKSLRITPTGRSLGLSQLRNLSIYYVYSNLVSVTSKRITAFKIN